MLRSDMYTLPGKRPSQSCVAPVPFLTSAKRLSTHVLRTSSYFHKENYGVFHEGKSLQSRKVPPFLFRGNDEKRSDELGNVFSPNPHREEAVNLVSLCWSKQVVLCPGCIERKTRCKVLRGKMSPYHKPKKTNSPRKKPTQATDIFPRMYRM